MQKQACHKAQKKSSTLDLGGKIHLMQACKAKWDMWKTKQGT